MAYSPPTPDKCDVCKKVYKGLNEYRTRYEGRSIVWYVVCYQCVKEDRDSAHI